MTKLDSKAEAVLKGCRGRVRPMTDGDLAKSAHISKASVRLRLNRLMEAGLVEEYWVGMRGPYFRVTPGQ